MKSARRFGIPGWKSSLKVAKSPPAGSNQSVTIPDSTGTHLQQHRILSNAEVPITPYEASPRVGDGAIDELLMDPGVLQEQDSAHGILRLARISRSTISARQRACQYAHREATYRLHICQEQLLSATSELSHKDMAIGRLRALIAKAGLSVQLMDDADEELVEDEPECA